MRFLVMLTFLAALFALTTIPGCGSDLPPPASLGFASSDIENGHLALAKGPSFLLGLEAYDADGRPIEIDTSALEWESSDPATIEVRGLGTAAAIRATRDWFDTVPGAGGDGGPDGGAGGSGGDPDAGAPDGGPTEPPHEPSATLTVRHGDVAASITVHAIINVAGRWRVTVGSIVQDISLEQNGRRVSYTGTTAAASGTINGDQFTLMQQGFMLTGTFTSRDTIAGTYTDPGGGTGEWSASRL